MTNSKAATKATAKTKTPKAQPFEGVIFMLDIGV